MRVTSPSQGLGWSGEPGVVRQVPGEAGSQGGGVARHGQSCEVAQVEMKPECLSSGGLLSEVGSPSEASHRSLSRSSLQQPHPRSHSHGCLRARQTPRRARAFRARLTDLPAGLRLVVGASPVPCCFFGERMSSIAHGNAPGEHFLSFAM